MTDPDVTIGVPVRNSGAVLSRTLTNLREQTYANTRIVISDNASTDETAAICLAAAEADSRIEYHRQDRPIHAMGNFEFTYRQACTPYFMWAADDDWRNANYVQALRAALERTPTASIAMGRLLLFADKDAPEDAVESTYVCSTEGRSLVGIVATRARAACYEMYGMFRTDALRTCSFRDYPFAPDFPIITHALAAGEVVQVEEAEFRYCTANAVKSHDEIALRNSFREAPPRLKTIRLIGYCAVEAARGSRTSRHRHPVAAAGAGWLGTALGLSRGGIFGAAPRWAQRAWWRRKGTNRSSA